MTDLRFNAESIARTELQCGCSVYHGVHTSLCPASCQSVIADRLVSFANEAAVAERGACWEAVRAACLACMGSGVVYDANRDADQPCAVCERYLDAINERGKR
jgi:hypothetical protein